jgi:hypothetical protein
MKSQQHNKNISLTYHNINRLPCKSCFKKEVFGGKYSIIVMALQKWHYRKRAVAQIATALDIK